MTDEAQLPATTASTEVAEYVGSESHWAQRPRQRQDITVALLPVALVIFVVVVFGVALWTLAATVSGP